MIRSGLAVAPVSRLDTIISSGLVTGEIVT